MKASQNKRQSADASMGVDVGLIQVMACATGLALDWSPRRIVDCVYSVSTLFHADPGRFGQLGEGKLGPFFVEFALFSELSTNGMEYFLSLDDVPRETGFSDSKELLRAISQAVVSFSLSAEEQELWATVSEDRSCHEALVAFCNISSDPAGWWTRLLYPIIPKGEFPRGFQTLIDQNSEMLRDVYPELLS